MGSTLYGFSPMGGIYTVNTTTGQETAVGTYWVPYPRSICQRHEYEAGKSRATFGLEKERAEVSLGSSPQRRSRPAAQANDLPRPHSLTIIAILLNA